MNWKKLGTGLVGAVMSAAVVGCSGTPEVTGLWVPDDGSATKTISDTGRCTGMYYYQGRTLDIGGPMMCTFGSTKNSSGRYSLIVEQPPNSATYEVAFTSSDTMVLYSGGTKIVTLRRK